MSKEFRAPDVKAPRFRQEGHNVLDKSFFKRLREKHDKCNTLSDSQIKKIIKRFNETVWETVVDYRDGVSLPESLGHIFIGSCNLRSNQNIDYGKSLKYGVAVDNRNWDTDGKIAKIFYTSYSNKYKYEFRECWGFRACRNFKRAVAKTFPENWMMYVAIESDKKLKNTYNAFTYKEYIKAKTESKLQDYNEFEI